jgi:hypothetical protein
MCCAALLDCLVVVGCGGVFGSFVQQQSLSSGLLYNSTLSLRWLSQVLLISGSVLPGLRGQDRVCAQLPDSGDKRWNSTPSCRSRLACFVATYEIGVFDLPHSYPNLVSIHFVNMLPYPPFHTQVVRLRLACSQLAGLKPPQLDACTAPASPRQP